MGQSHSSHTFRSEGVSKCLFSVPWNKNIVKVLFRLSAETRVCSLERERIRVGRLECIDELKTKEARLESCGST